VIGLLLKHAARYASRPRRQGALLLSLSLRSTPLEGLSFGRHWPAPETRGSLRKSPSPPSPLALISVAALHTASRLHLRPGFICSSRTRLHCRHAQTRRLGGSLSLVLLPVYTVIY